MYELGAIFFQRVVLRKPNKLQENLEKQLSILSEKQQKDRSNKKLNSNH